MSEAVVAEPGKHPGAIGVDLGAGGYDVAGERQLIAVRHLSQIQPLGPDGRWESLDGDRDRRLLGAAPGLP